VFKTIVFSAFGAGLAVCVVVSAVQLVTTEPLILHAEEFEVGAGEGYDQGAHPEGIGAVATEVHVYEAGEAHVHDGEEWRPADGFERVAYTMLANLVIAFAVSLTLLGGMALNGNPIDARSGLLWGAAGFVALSLLPALGLPPELPGTPAADIVARQVWWLGAAPASAAGIALIAFSRHWAAKAAGVALLVAPHIIGAPAPPSHDVPYPGALAGEFVIASLVVSALLWLLSGLAAGWLHQRLSRAE